MPIPATKATCGARRVAASSRAQSLPDNLIREVVEETGLTVTVGDPAS